MANLEIEGKLVRKLPVQSGRSVRGDWSKQEFVVEFPDGNFTSSACFNVWGPEKVKDLERFQVGDAVKVSFTPSSREFNGRWYNDLRAWRIAPAGQAEAAPAPAPRGAEDIPAGFAPAAPAPTVEDLPSAGFDQDDLPF